LKILQLEIFDRFRSLDVSPESLMCEECLIDLSGEERITKAVKCQVSLPLLLLLFIVIIVIIDIGL
jgi:hypothetical protein